MISVPFRAMTRSAFVSVGLISVVTAGTTLGVFAFFHSTPAVAEAAGSTFGYTFNSPGTLYEAPSSVTSSSPYFWLKSGAALVIEDGYGASVEHELSASDAWFKTYATRLPLESDDGAHPQNLFFLLTKDTMQSGDASVYLERMRDNFSNPANQHSYSGESVLVRYQDENNYYIGSIRADGYAVIKKKVNGVYRTLAEKKLFPGTYGANDLSLIPHYRWIGLRLSVSDTSRGPQLSLYTDYGWSGTWKLAVTGVDDPAVSGPTIESAGTVGIKSDYADVQLDNIVVHGFGTTEPVQVVAPETDAKVAAQGAAYDSVVLADGPALYLAMHTPGSGVEHDLSGHNLDGTYKGGTPAASTLPNGESAAAFNGNGQYVLVPSSPTLSIAHTGELTWEGWVRADTLTFPKATASGYVDWMGKCQNYSPACEWEARLYSTDTTENRPSRFSAYVFNPSAGLGSGADWQPSTGALSANEWIYVVAEYQTKTTPAVCPPGTPGTIAIWIDGIPQSFTDHAPTGCMSQFQVTPSVTDSPLTIGTMALDSWFPGAIGKVAVYDYLLTQDQINAHFTAMTGQVPAGSCGVTCSLSGTMSALLTAVL